MKMSMIRPKPLHMFTQDKHLKCSKPNARNVLFLPKRALYSGKLFKNRGWPLARLSLISQPDTCFLLIVVAMRSCKELFKNNRVTFLKLCLMLMPRDA